MTLSREEIQELNDKADAHLLKRKRKKTLRILAWLGFSGIVVLLDQLSKWGVTEYMIRPRIFGDTQGSLDFLSWYADQPARLPFAHIEVFDFFNFVMVWNTGVSFGMMAQAGPYAPYILVALALGIAGLFTVWLVGARENIHRFCYALVIGGAIGNVIDRLRFKAVIDFLDFHLGSWHYPAFNVADSAVVLGVGGLIFALAITDFKRKKELKTRIKNRTEERKRFLKRFGLYTKR
ncbi:MAG: signal peptidase II [Alphaproteobacteria bacterium]|nr:signal peptidase II [Alphaproteobacteria bacterium]